eukprot:15452491-Alexandrium_andersonii.AAC.3
MLSCVKYPGGHFVVCQFQAVDDASVDGLELRIEEARDILEHECLLGGGRLSLLAIGLVKGASCRNANHLMCKRRGTLPKMMRGCLWFAGRHRLDRLEPQLAPRVVEASLASSMRPGLARNTSHVQLYIAWETVHVPGGDVIERVVRITPRVLDQAPARRVLVASPSGAHLETCGLQSYARGLHAREVGGQRDVPREALAAPDVLAWRVLRRRRWLRALLLLVARAVLRCRLGLCLWLRLAARLVVLAVPRLPLGRRR